MISYKNMHNKLILISLKTLPSSLLELIFVDNRTTKSTKNLCSRFLLIWFSTNQSPYLIFSTNIFSFCRCATICSACSLALVAGRLLFMRIRFIKLNRTRREMICEIWARSSKTPENDYNYFLNPKSIVTAITSIENVVLEKYLTGQCQQ